MKSMNFSLEDWFSQLHSIADDVNALNFAIPEQIFVVMNSLTNVVGYIMPLRLYIPIITLVLGYWFVCIFAAAYRMSFSLLGGLSSFSRFLK